MTSDVAIRHFFFVEDLKLIVYAEALISTLVVALSLYVAYRRWVRGYGGLGWGGPSSAARRLAVYALFQARVTRRRFPGLLHALVFAGMLWLFIATLLRSLDFYVAQFLVGPVWQVYKLLSNVAGAMVIAGSLLAIILRLRSPRHVPSDHSYYIVHASFIFIVVTGFALNGMVASAYRRGFESPLYDPIGYAFFLLAEGLSYQDLRELYRVLWVVHLTAAQIAIALIPFTNLWHIIGSSVWVALSPAGHPLDSLRSYPDVEERIERDKPVGVLRLGDTTPMQRVMMDACTNCMRCTSVCPALASGKILDPRLVVLGMRELMRRGEWDSVVWETGVRGVEAESFWSCVTCGACVSECPVLINHVDLILDVRRGMVYSGGEEVPEDAVNALYNIQQVGNPLGRSPREREEWLAKLSGELGGDVIARPGEEYEYLYWVGCVTSFDPRIRPVAESVIRLLRGAGVRVAVVPEHSCTGEPAARMGEEALFLELMARNLEVLSKYRFKVLLVNCPHCLTVFTRDYRRYSGYLESRGMTRLKEFLEGLRVEHHTVALARLLRRGAIKASPELRATVTYHDPCYLGRWNGVFEEPRYLIRASKGVIYGEMPRSRERSFCCGGGGGQLFYEIKRGKRISRVRSEEASKTLSKLGGGDKVLAVACPFCNTMFRGEAESLGFKVKDVAEILAGSKP